MTWSVDLSRARATCLTSVTALVEAVEECEEVALLDASRCRGWTRLDVVVHTVAGWQELLGGIVSPTDDAPTVDAASYWTELAAAEDDDPVPALMAQRRRTAAYLRPGSAVAQLRDVAGALAAGITGLDERHRRWQGHVLTPGDLLTTWAVENAVHHLDLLVGSEPPADALALARETVEALSGALLPEDWSDEQAVLVGAGRVPVPVDAGPAGARLPVLG